MKFLCYSLITLFAVSGLGAQCEFTVKIDAKSELKICAGSFYTLRPVASANANFVWFKDGKQVVLPFNGHCIVSEPGAYTVAATATDSPFCKALSTEVVVSVIDVPLVELFAAKPSFCQGDTVKIGSKVESTGTWNLQWFKNDLPIADEDGDSVLVSSGGSYSLRMQQDACEVYSGAVAIKELPKPKANFEFNATNQNGINFTNLSEGGVGFAWSFGDGKTSKLANPSHVFGSPGSYNVELTATAKNGCSDVVSKSLSLGTTSTTSLESPYTDLAIYPNPTTGPTNLHSENTDLSGAAVYIFDVQGKFLELQKVGSAGLVDLSGYDAGMYLLSIRLPDLQLTRKVTKL